MINYLNKIAIIIITSMIIIGSANAQTTQNTQQIAQAVDTVFLYQQVDEKPLFNGKEPFEKGGFRDYIRENSCKCLFETYGYGIPDTMLIEFVIDIDGSIINVQILKHIDPLLDAEALRVVNSSPKWTSGKQGGKTVKVKYILPIRAQNIGGCVVPPGWSEECMRCLQENRSQGK